VWLRVLQRERGRPTHVPPRGGDAAIYNSFFSRIFRLRSTAPLSSLHNNIAQSMNFVRFSDGPPHPRPARLSEKRSVIFSHSDTAGEPSRNDFFPLYSPHARHCVKRASYRVHREPYDTVWYYDVRFQSFTATGSICHIKTPCCALRSPHPRIRRRIAETALTRRRVVAQPVVDRETCVWPFKHTKKMPRKQYYTDRRNWANFYSIFFS